MSLNDIKSCGESMNKLSALYCEHPCIENLS